jgi:phenylacetate-CoA ligase
VLAGLEGRTPVPLQSADGRAVNTIDVTVALRRLPLARFTVHQRADRGLDVGLEPGGSSAGAALAPAIVADAEAALLELFGPVPVTITSLAGTPERVTYSSALPAD